jgi:hypothetical protein
MEFVDNGCTKREAGMNAWLEPIASVVTAFGTLALSFFTIVLARETKRLADVGEQPNVIVTFEPNRHMISHLDMHVENTGTAAAYDIQVRFSPEIKIAHGAPDRRLPLQSISLLKSKQAIFSSLCDYGELETKNFTVTTSWRRRPSEGKREELSYSVDIELLDGLTHLGGDPLVEGAQALKKVSEGIDRISRGSSRLAVNTFNSAERAEEERRQEEFFERQRARQNSPAISPGLTLPDEPPESAHS